MRRLSLQWRTCWRSIPVHMIRPGRSCAWTRHQRTRHRKTPLLARPGRPARYGYEYARNGTASLFILFAPLEGWREVNVTERRTTIDYAQVLKELSDVHFAVAEKIVLVQDNLNTHNPRFTLRSIHRV